MGLGGLAGAGPPAPPGAAGSQPLLAPGGPGGSSAPPPAGAGGRGGAGPAGPAGAERTGAVLVTLLVTVLAGLSAALRLLLPDRGRPRLLPEQAAKLARLRERAAAPFDREDAEHLSALRELWAASFPEPGEDPPSDLRTPRWKEMGWQGVDPATDFRAGGFLALENLLYLSRRHPAVWRELRHKTRGKRSDWEYPFAIAGVNITFALAQMLGVAGGGEGAGRGGGGRPLGRARAWARKLGTDLLGRPPALGMSPEGKAFARLLAHPDADDRLFDEVYCAAFQLLDRLWLREGATYMEFNAVMDKVKAEISRVLLGCLQRGGGLEGDSPAASFRDLLADEDSSTYVPPAPVL